MSHLGSAALLCSSLSIAGKSICPKSCCSTQPTDVEAPFAKKHRCRRQFISSTKYTYSNERSASMISSCFLYFFNSGLVTVKDTENTLRPEPR